MFAAMVMLGAAYTLKVNEHVRVDMFYGSLSARGKAKLDLAGLIVFLMPAMLLLAWLSGRFSSLRGRSAKCRAAREGWSAGRSS